jgi:hypothetical protein
MPRKKPKTTPKEKPAIRTAAKEEMQDLHALIARGLKDRIESGEATAADYSVAVKFLKDNGIEVAAPEDNDALNELCDVLPFGEKAGLKIRKASSS